MSFLAKMFGPKSKYDSSLPYTYEARVPMFGDGGGYKSYFADTICGLLAHLHRQGVRPDGVSLLEIYRKTDTPIDAHLLVTPAGEWLFKPDLCRVLESHYPGHIHDSDCSFSDRTPRPTGP